jgi:hypothetical protein
MDKKSKTSNDFFRMNGTWLDNTEFLLIEPVGGFDNYVKDSLMRLLF